MIFSIYYNRNPRPCAKIFFDSANYIVPYSIQIERMKNEGKVSKGKFDDDFDESVFDFEKEIKIQLEKQKR